MPEYELELITRESEPVAPLPSAQLEKVTWTLNAPGSLSFSMQQSDPDVSKPLLLQHEVRCTIEGVDNPWQGPIWQDSQTPRSVTFDAEDIGSYLYGKHIDFSTLIYDDPAGADQFEIGWGLIQYAQGIPLAQAGSLSIPSKSFNVTAGDLSPSGRRRLRRYLRDEHAEILPLLQEFAGLRNFFTGDPDGFDFEFITTRDGQRLWQPYYPKKGSLRMDLTLEYGRNVTDYTVRGDAKTVTTKTYATGQNNGDVKLEANYEDAAASALYTQMTKFIDYSEEFDPAALQEFARRYTEDFKDPILSPELKTVEVPITLLGDLQVGDTVPVSISNGRTQVNDIFRVGTITWNIRPNTLDITILPKAEA
jgi:hypothetical protein